MRKLTKLAFLGAIVLTAIGCQKELGSNAALENSSEVKEVTTQFVLNVASAPQTKQSAVTVQKATNFRGVENAVLLTYNVTDLDASATHAYVNKTTAPAAGTFKKFDLGTLYTNGSISAGDNQTSDSRRIIQLTVPINSDAVLLYGKAIPGTPSASVSSEKLNGATSASISSTPSETIFAATKILKDAAKVTQYDATAALMIYVINQCIRTKVVASSADYKGYKDLPELKWETLGHQYEYNLKGAQSRYTDPGITLSALEEVLGMTYYTFTNISDTEYRAGSSNAVSGMIVDMAKVVKAAAAQAGTPANAKDANAQRLASEISSVTTKYVLSETGAYLELSQLKSVIPADDWAAGGFDNALDLNQYPRGDFGLPEGCAQLGFHAKGASYAQDEFYYLHPNKPLVNPEMVEFEPRKYLYPAELLYYVNSSIRTSSKNDLSASDYPNGVTPWATDSQWGSSWNSSVVTSSTRGVAVRDNVNYGVAMMKTAVAYANGITTLYDNRKAMTGNHEEDRAIAVADAAITLQGILIGGVNPRMNWQFTRYYTENNTPSTDNNLSLFDGVIYDDQVVSTAIPTGAGGETYTLVYDNYNSSETTQNDVYVALEFVNNGDDFWGRDNLIKKNSVFYMVAKLRPSAYDSSTNPSGSSTSITWPTDHQVPPLYGVDGETVPAGKIAGKSKEIARVFIQDFMTSVTFRIGEQSLKNAYYSVPDLRASQMSLGLSVDLSWEAGFTYDVTF